MSNKDYKYKYKVDALYFVKGFGQVYFREGQYAPNEIVEAFTKGKKQVISQYFEEIEKPIEKANTDEVKEGSDELHETDILNTKKSNEFKPKKRAYRKHK